MSYTFNPPPQDNCPFEVLGAFGGLVETDCSCYKIKKSSIYLDAGAIGKIKVGEKKTFLLTHSHIDHIGGLLCYLEQHNLEKNITIYSDSKKEEWQTLVGKKKLNSHIHSPTILNKTEVDGYKITAKPLHHGSYKGDSYVYILDGTNKKDSIVYFGDFDMDDATSKSYFQQAIQEIPNSGNVHVLMECATPSCNMGKNCFGHINEKQYQLNIKTILITKKLAKFTFYVTHRKPSFNTLNIKNISIPADLTLKDPEFLKLKTKVPVIQIVHGPFLLSDESDGSDGSDRSDGWSFDENTQTVTTQKFKIDSLQNIFALLVKIPPLINLAYGGKKVIIRINGGKKSLVKVLEKWCNGKYWPSARFICAHEKITVKIGEISYSTGSMKAGFGLTRKLHPEFRQFILKI